MATNSYQPPIISDQYGNVSAILAPPEQIVWNAFIAMLTAVTEVLGELTQDQYLMILDVAAHLAVSAGEVPYIGSNGNWWLGGTDTGTSANGLPGPQGPQGVPGTPGQGFQVLGAYPDLASLQAAHPTGNPGDAYAVGTAPNQAVYIWSNGQWVNIGPLMTGLPYMGSAPPPNPAVGNLWFDTVGVQCYIYYNDGTSIQWVPLINQGITTGGGGGGGTAGVSSFNTRTGDVLLASTDVTGVGGALLAGPAFTGIPTAPTALAGTATSQLATTSFVTSAIGSLPANVSSWNTRTGAVTFTTADLTAVGGVTGGPYALINSPALTGTPTAPTATAGTATTQLATTAFVVNSISAISAGVVSFNGRSGAVTLTTADITAAGAVTGGPYAIQTNPVGGQNNYAAINSQVFTGTPSLPTGTVAVTQTAGTSNTTIATTGFVNAALTSLPPSGAVISATAPASPTVGELWFDSTGLQTYVYYYDGNSYQWAPTINQGTWGSSFLAVNNPTYTGALTNNGAMNVSAIYLNDNTQTPPNLMTMSGGDMDGGGPGYELIAGATRTAAGYTPTSTYATKYLSTLSVTGDGYLNFATYTATTNAVIASMDSYVIFGLIPQASYGVFSTYPYSSDVHDYTPAFYVSSSNNSSSSMLSLGTTWTSGFPNTNPRAYFGCAAQNTGTAWFANAATPSIISHENGLIRLYANTGVTSGNTYTPTQVAQFGSTGVTVGSPTSGAMGAGTLNATNLYVNGVAVGGGGAPLTNPTAGQNNYMNQVGRVDGSNAPAGQVGEYASVNQSTQVALPTASGTTGTVCTLTLSAGDWDVWGGAYPQNTTNAIGFQIYISPTASAQADMFGRGGMQIGGQTNTWNTYVWANSGPRRFSSNTTQTVYLLATVIFTGAAQSPTAIGYIYARRVR